MATTTTPEKGLEFTIYGERQVFAFHITSVRSQMVYYTTVARWEAGRHRTTGMLSVSAWQRLAEETWWPDAS